MKIKKKYKEKIRKITKNIKKIIERETKTPPWIPPCHSDFCFLAIFSTTGPHPLLFSKIRDPPKSVRFI